MLNTKYRFLKIFLRREDISRNVANAFKHLGRVVLVHVIILLAHPVLVHKYVKICQTNGVFFPFGMA